MADISRDEFDGADFNGTDSAAEYPQAGRIGRIAIPADWRRVFTDDVGTWGGSTSLELDRVTRLDCPPGSIRCLLLDADELNARGEIPNGVAKLPIRRVFFGTSTRDEPLSIQVDDALVEASRTFVTRQIPHRSRRSAAASQGVREVDLALHASSLLTNKEISFGKIVPELDA